jgi:hypothetical protein
MANVMCSRDVAVEAWLLLWLVCASSSRPCVELLREWMSVGERLREREGERVCVSEDEGTA